MVDVDLVESLLVLSHGPCCSHDSISQDLHIRKSQWVGELGQLEYFYRVCIFYYSLSLAFDDE